MCGTGGGHQLHLWFTPNAKHEARPLKSLMNIDPICPNRLSTNRSKISPNPRVVTAGPVGTNRGRGQIINHRPALCQNFSEDNAREVWCIEVFGV